MAVGCLAAVPAIAEAAIVVTNTATPLSRSVPGGSFTFSVVVTSTGPVTIISLTDDVYGDLATQGTCTTAVGTFLAGEANASYSCSFAGSFFGIAGASQTDTVTARAADVDGNTLTGSDAATVTITPPPTITPPSDLVAPETTITKTKINRAKRRAKFAFISSEPGSTFECKLDKKPLKSCTSPTSYRRLKPGKHKFQVAARDVAGNLDLSPAVKKFKIKG
ncbi:MAG: hypothetical protein ABIZ50_02335 [Solirubrobacterales bacterium]